MYKPNIIQIKGLLPGSGKTQVLVNLFHNDEYDPTYKYIITHSWKAAQECKNRIQLLFPNTYKLSYLNKHIISLRKYKRNYRKLISANGVSYYPVESEDDTSRAPVNLYIDEVSLITEMEGTDLLKHFWINNLILAGDVLQHKPVGSSWVFLNQMREVVREEDGNILQVLDTGNNWCVNPNFQVLLNKQLRASDPRLIRVLELIRDGQILEALTYCKLPKEEPLYTNTDWHVCYSNEQCNRYNKLYIDRGINDRFIVVENDNELEMYKGEIYNTNDEGWLRKQDQHRIICLEKSDSISSFDDSWKRRIGMFMVPAYAITSHKLQGSKIETGDIFIHLDDAWRSITKYVEDEDEMVDRFIRFLYVAISRAVSLDQINIWGVPDIRNLETSLIGRFIIGCNEHPLVDNDIREDALVTNSLDETLIPAILSRYYKGDGKDHPVYKRVQIDISKAHSVKHKEHNVRKDKKFTDEYLLNISYEDLKKQTTRRDVRNQWKKLHTLV